MERREFYFTVEPLSAVGFTLGVLGVGVPWALRLRKKYGWYWRSLGVRRGKATVV